MNEMVDRVARALAANPALGDYDEVPVDEVFSRPRYAHLKQMYERQARAAIQAMRDPTEVMVRKGEDAMPFGGPMRQGYRAMIDAALEEKS